MNELRLATSTIWKLLLDDDKLDPEERELATSMEEEAIIVPLKEKFNYFKEDFVEYFATNEAESIIEYLNETMTIKSKFPAPTVIGLFRIIRESIGVLQSSSLADQCYEILDDLISQASQRGLPRDPKIGVAILVIDNKVVNVATGKSAVRALERLMEDRGFEGTCSQFIATLAANQCTHRFELVLEAGEWKKV